MDKLLYWPMRIADIVCSHPVETFYGLVVVLALMGVVTAYRLCEIRRRGYWR
jgi:hypothetical protein